MLNDDMAAESITVASNYERFDNDVADDVRLLESSTLEMVTLNFASWNQLDGWLRQVEGLRRVA